MKKIILSLIAVGVMSISAQADAFEDNLNGALAKNIGMSISVIQKNELANWKGVYFTIIESKQNKQRFPLFVSGECDRVFKLDDNTFKRG